MAEGDVRAAVLAEADRLVENCNFSSQRHFETVHHWEYWRDVLGLPTTILAAVASATAFGELFGSGVAAGIVALVVTVLSAINTYLNPSQKAERHRASGNAYLTLRNTARRFSEIHARRAMSDEDLVGQVEVLARQVDQLNSDSPPTPAWAYEKARANIERGQTTNRADAGQSP